MARVIIHIDLNAFFASVEEIKNPKLVGKAHAVGGSIKRGVLSTCSYKARELGIHSAMPVAQALRICPNLIINPGDYKLYKEYSNKFFTIVEKWCGSKMEIASIDECYVDVSDYKKYTDDLVSYLKKMQLYIKETLNLGCSIGVAPNKFLAKMASDMKKPMGITVLRIRDVPEKCTAVGSPAKPIKFVIARRARAPDAAIFNDAICYPETKYGRAERNRALE